MCHGLTVMCSRFGFIYIYLWYAECSFIMWFSKVISLYVYAVLFPSFSSSGTPKSSMMPLLSWFTCLMLFFILKNYLSLCALF